MTKIINYIREEIEKIKTGKEKPEKYHITNNDFDKTVNIINEITVDKNSIIFNIDENTIKVIQKQEEEQ